MSLVQRSQCDRRPTGWDEVSQTDLIQSNEIPTCIATAIEAFSQGLLHLDYFKDGWKHSVKSTKEIPSLIRSGFTLRRVDGKFYLSRGLLGGAPTVFSTTQALADQLKKTDLAHEGYSSLQALALRVIDLFAETPTKTKPLIEEVTALAFTNNTVITKSLLKVLVKEINQGELLDIDLLKALKTTLINALIDALDPDDLIRVLKITIQRITQIHQQDKTSYKLYTALSTLSDILDVMGDANVIKVGRIDTHDPLYKILDTFSDDDDILIAAQAAYAKQSLVRVPNDESKMRSFLRHGTALVQGCASLYYVISGQSLSSLVDAYDHFKAAVDFQEGKKQWYGDVRILKLLSDKKLYETFTKVVDTHIKDTANPHIVGNILFILHAITHYDADLQAKKWALDRMGNLFLDDAKWGDKKKVKKSILAQLLACVALPDQATSTYAKEALIAIGEKSNTNQQKRLIEDVLEDLDQVTPKAIHHVEESSTTLITAAQRSSFLSLEQKLEQLKEQTLQDEDVLKDLAAYIPVLGSRCLFDPKEQTFDLDQVVNEFLKGNQKVFLLLGDSGGGKSTYLRYLENRLWKEWVPGKPIPLFISLPALKFPFKEAITEALKERGFTEAEQKELKSKHPFLFLLDGYDELKAKKNLYDANQLHQWQAQTIITCRTQYLTGEQSSYHNYFSPPAANLISTISLDEASVSPFTPQQIEAYGRKFISLHKIPRTWEQYQADIASIPDLAEMIETPFILRIIAEVLPSVIEANQQSKSQEKLKLLRVEIFDAFVKNWFNREERRIQRMDTEIHVPDIKKAFADFASRLALEMVQAGVVSVDYEENSGLFDQSSSKWAKFFSSDPKMVLVRSGIPLRKIGPYSYAFIHKSLLEYFSARSIISHAAFKSTQQGSSSSVSSTVFSSHFVISFENLNKKILTKEPEIIRLLVECVTKDPSLIEHLFRYVECSKTDSHAATAAANAITVLKGAQINLSRRNFERVRIAGADLSHAILTATNLSHADLRDVQLNEAVLDYSTIAYSETAGLELGQKPFINIPSFHSFAISPDLKWALLGSYGGPVSLWDCQTGKEKFSFFGHRGPVGSVAFSPDLKCALSGGDDHVIRLWDCTTGKELRTFLGHTNKITEVVFSPDGKSAISGSHDQTIRLWDCLTGKERLTFRGKLNNVYSVAFSPDSKLAVSGSLDHIIRLWDCQTGEELRSFVGHTDRVLSLAFSPDGKSVLSGGDKTVRLWDCQTGKESFCFIGHTGQVCHAIFSPDGKWVLSGSTDKTVRLWNCQTGKEHRLFLAHSDHVYDVAFSSDGNYVVSACSGNPIRIWDLNQSALPQTKKAPARVLSLCVSSDGKWALSGNERSAVLLCCQTGKEQLSFLKHCLNGKHETVNSVAISSDGKWALSGGGDNEVRLWDCRTGEERFCFVGHSAVILGVAFSPDGKRALSGSADGTTRLWDCQTGKELFSFLSEHSVPWGSSFYCVAFSPDGKSVLSGGNDQAVHFWDCQTGKERLFLGHTGSVSSVAFSPDGNSVLSGEDGELDGDFTVRLWDSKTGQEKFSFIGHQNGICKVGFFPNGKWAFSGSNDQTVRLWDCQTGKQLYCLTLSQSVVDVALLPDGKSLLVSTSQPAIQMWELFDENGHFQPSLKWSTGMSILSAQQLNMEGVKGLSEDNRKLLLQHGSSEQHEKK